MTHQNRRFASPRVWAAIVTALLAAPPLAAAQTLYGTITGTITDAQGSNVPGATVSIRNEATGLEMTSVTDEAGSYTIRNVAGGTIR